MLYYNCINTHNTVERGEYVLKLNYKNPKPLHEQISQGIKGLIMCGALRSDEQLPSVRDLSVELTVNPNTVQRAYKTLEAEGVIYSIRGKGNFVTPSPEAEKKNITELYESLSAILRELAYFGEDKSAVESVVNKIFEERMNDND